MSAWNHHLCDECWAVVCFANRQEGREPTRVRDDPEGPCCGCGKETSSGIYYRGDPKFFQCQGKHPETDCHPEDPDAARREDGAAARWPNLVVRVIGEVDGERREVAVFAWCMTCGGFWERSEGVEGKWRERRP